VGKNEEPQKKKSVVQRWKKGGTGRTKRKGSQQTAKQFLKAGGGQTKRIEQLRGGQQVKERGNLGFRQVEWKSYETERRSAGGGKAFSYP